MHIRIAGSLRAKRGEPDEDSIVTLAKIINFQLPFAIWKVIDSSGKPMKRDCGLVLRETAVADPIHGTTTKVVVKGTVECSAADTAGIQTGDVIFKLDDKEIRTKQQFYTMIRKQSAESIRKLILIRDGEKMTVELPASAGGGDCTYRETVPDVLDSPRIEGMSQRDVLFRTLLAKEALDRMKDSKAKRAFVEHYLDGQSHAEMVKRDKEFYKSENNCCVLSNRGFGQAARLLEECAKEKLMLLGRILSKGEMAIYWAIIDESRELQKKFEKY
jgi:hypothetical protein